MKPIRVVLADDHNILRAGVRSLLERVPGVEVVAEAQDGGEALAAVGAHRPDVLLTDIAMPGLNGLEVTGRVARDFPGVRVIILSMHAAPEYVARALQAGAAGYLLKDADPAELAVAVQAVARGEAYLTPRVSKQVLAKFVEAAGNEPGETAALTPRQREVLQLIAEGKSTKEIARILRVSAKTVETHRAHLMGRLHIHEVAGLVRYAVRHGLVQAE